MDKGIILCQKSVFHTTRQSEVNLKMANRSKYVNFDFIVEYPIWVTIKRTLTGKLAVYCQNLIYSDRFEENVQKHLKKVIPGKVQISSVFGGLLHIRNLDL